MERRSFIQSALAAVAVTTLRPAKARALSRPWQEYVLAGRGASDVEAVTGDGRRVTLRGADLEDLAKRLRGRLLLAGDAGYEEARQILNPSFDKRPALIAQVTGSADVATAVDFARDHGGLLLAVKCGGHSLSGKSTCDMGMMIDLSPFRAVRVDPSARRAWVTGGSLLGSVDHETAAHELVTPLGTVSHTGVGGLVTGGGFGRLSRRFGLSIDNLTGVDVVAADGRLYRANEGENADLFWGVRGGGGNFGVVTNFEFRLHPMQRQVMGGDIVFPIARVRDVLEMYAEYAPVAPDDVQLDWFIAQPPGDAPGVTGIAVCYSGPHGDADRVLAPIRRLGNIIADEVRVMEYVELQRSGDMADPRAQGQYATGGFVTSMSPAVIDAIVDGFEGDPRRATVMFTQHSGGAIERVPIHATAFAQRDVLANLLAGVGWQHGSDDGARHIEWARGLWRRIEPHTHGFYVNDLELDTSLQQIRENYRENHARLVAVKNRYDPTNLFRLNANVLPTV
jgi:FAD/FMN-containing dehydrogenase